MSGTHLQWSASRREFEKVAGKAESLVLLTASWMALRMAWRRVMMMVRRKALKMVEMTALKMVETMASTTVGLKLMAPLIGDREGNNAQN